MAELDNKQDLWSIIDRNCSSQLSELHKRTVLDFYLQVRDLV